MAQIWAFFENRYFLPNLVPIRQIKTTLTHTTHEFTPTIFTKQLKSTSGKILAPTKKKDFISASRKYTFSKLKPDLMAPQSEKNLILMLPNISQSKCEHAEMRRKIGSFFDAHWVKTNEVIRNFGSWVARYFEQTHSIFAKNVYLKQRTAVTELQYEDRNAAIVVSVVTKTATAECLMTRYTNSYFGRCEFSFFVRSHTLQIMQASSDPIPAPQKTKI